MWFLLRRRLRRLRRLRRQNCRRRLRQRRRAVWVRTTHRHRHRRRAIRKGTDAGRSNAAADDGRGGCCGTCGDRAERAHARPGVREAAARGVAKAATAAQVPKFVAEYGSSYLVRRRLDFFQWRDFQAINLGNFPRVSSSAHAPAFRFLAVTSQPTEGQAPPGSILFSVPVGVHAIKKKRKTRKGRR